jgi:hypothetical protein
LDPHQKGILSDDFGVAVSTQWLSDQLGGFSSVVDGRRFMLQFADLIQQRKSPKAKVGPSKAPDFVIQDNNGRWHILECNQVAKSRNDQLNTALSQKHVIQINGA